MNDPQPRGPNPSRPEPNPGRAFDDGGPTIDTKQVITSVLTAVTVLLLAAVLAIPVVWVIVHGYRWALS